MATKLRAILWWVLLMVPLIAGAEQIEEWDRKSDLEVPFVRSSETGRPGGRLFGDPWFSHWDMNVRASGNTVTATRRDGTQQQYVGPSVDAAWNGARWEPTDGSNTYVTFWDGFRYVDENNTIEGYRADGRLWWICGGGWNNETQRCGWSYTLVYSTGDGSDAGRVYYEIPGPPSNTPQSTVPLPAGLLSEIREDHTGRKLTLDYNPGGRVVKIGSEIGATWYAYRGGYTGPMMYAWDPDVGARTYNYLPNGAIDSIDSAKAPITTMDQFQKTDVFAYGELGEVMEWVVKPLAEQFKGFTIFNRKKTCVDTTTPFIPDRLKLPSGSEGQFTDSCKQNLTCYSTCGQAKSQCDQQLLQNLMRACDSATQS